MKRILMMIILAWIPVFAGMTNVVQAQTSATVRTYAAIMALLADNTTGDISPQDLRDAIASAWAKADSVEDALADSMTAGRYRLERTVSTDTTMTLANFPSGCTVYVTGPSEVTTPTAAAGLWYRFVAVGTDSVILLSGSGDNIDVIGAANATNLCATGTEDETVVLECKDATSWKEMDYLGTWGSY